MWMDRYVFIGRNGPFLRRVVTVHKQKDSTRIACNPDVGKRVDWRTINSTGVQRKC